jgi:hypothetical protein
MFCYEVAVTVSIMFDAGSLSLKEKETGVVEWLSRSGIGVIFLSSRASDFFE